MHYYQFNIGDYRRRTQYLTPMEHGVYRLLLDTYYLTEKPLCIDHAELMRTHCIRNADEMQAFENILKDFFILTENGYFHDHCDEEIKKYQEKSEKARKSAKKRWEGNANGMRTHSEGNANHKPITNNHKPKDQNLLPENLKVSMPNDFMLNDTNKKWISDSNLTDMEKNEVIADFVDYWKLDEAKKTEKGWQMAFRKNPIVKRAITNSKHRGKNNGQNQQDNRSRTQRVSDKLREIAINDINENGFTEKLD